MNERLIIKLRHSTFMKSHLSQPIIIKKNRSQNQPRKLLSEPNMKYVPSFLFSHILLYTYVRNFSKSIVKFNLKVKIMTKILQNASTKSFHLHLESGFEDSKTTWV